MGLIDTHAHLESFALKGELAGVLARAEAAGVEKIVTVGTGPDDWVLYREIAAAHPALVCFAVGLHPCSVGEDWAGAFAQMEDFWNLAHACRPVAMGEVGLDRFHLPKDEAEASRIFGWQQAAFAEQLALARRLDCPVVVHARGAFRETVELIDARGVDWSRVVYHCFAEGAEEISELVARGGRGSFTGVLTYKNAENVRAAAKAQGLDRFMLETDAPYLTPVPHRGKPNEPAFVRHTAEYAATVFGVSYEELVARSAANARVFFGL